MAEELTYDEKVRRAKVYGKAHGYEGRTGGWIYGPSGGRALCQGWEAFYRRSRVSIEQARST